MNVLIRECAPHDYQKINEICEKTGFFIPFFGYTHYLKMIEKCRQWERHPLLGFEMLVAEVDGRVVGFAFASKELVVGSVALLAVHPEYQGRGIGSMLLKEACERLRRKMVRWMVIMMDPGAKAERRERLIRFYRRHGFKTFGILCIKKLA